MTDVLRTMFTVVNIAEVIDFVYCDYLLKGMAGKREA